MGSEVIMGLTSLIYLAQGLSYWKVKLRPTSLSKRREFSELDMTWDAVRGHRPLDWALDIVGTGDNTRIEELMLVTPGHATGRGGDALQGATHGVSVQAWDAGYAFQWAYHSGANHRAR